MPTLDEYISDKKTYPDETTVKLGDGVDVTLGQLRSGFMKDADYRQKTSALARQREEFDRDYNAKTQALVQAEQRLQELARETVRANPGVNRDEVAEQIADNPVAQRLMKQITELQSVVVPLAQAVVKLDQQQKSQQDAWGAEQHRRVLAHLKTKDPELDEQALIDHARTRLTPRLDVAYRDMTYEAAVAKAAKAAREEGIKEGAEKARAEAAAQMIPLRRTPTLAPDAPKTMEEAREAAYRDPEIIGALTARAF